MTREEKIAKSRELKAEGWTSPQISEVVDAPESTIRNWCLGGTCSRCGAPFEKSDGRRATTLCNSCRVRDGADRLAHFGRLRTERFIRLREQGLLNYEIAELHGVKPHCVAQAFSRAGRYGLTVPRPPYWERSAA